MRAHAEKAIELIRSMLQARPVYLRALAWMPWVACFCWVAILILQGRPAPVCFRVYMRAGLNWYFYAPLYDLSNIDGFQYFPHAAIIFAPFWRLGSPFRDLLWRALAWSAYAVGAWLLARRASERKADATFFIVGMLSIGPAVDSLFRGQVSLAVAALVILATAAVMDARWTLASLCLVLGVALKPITLVPLTLFALVYPPLRWRLLAGLMVVALVPLALRDLAYVWAQYASCWRKLLLSAQPNRRFEDVAGLLGVAGLALSARVLFALRASAGVAVAALCVLARKRTSGSNGAPMIAALSVNYLVLFSPRSQANSYVLVGVFAALSVLRLARERRVVSALATLAIIVVWTVKPRFAPWSEFWLKPVGSIAFFAVLIEEVLGRKRTWQREKVEGDCTRTIAV